MTFMVTRKLDTPDSVPPVSLDATRLRSLMQSALFHARAQLGQTSPNPSVGAVIADAQSGEIISSAATATGGRPHAEVLALQRAGSRAHGAVLFCTLEPCSHYGASPPCADAIVEAGISAVIYGSLDPDPRVSGRGLARLSANNVPVMQSEMVGEADWLNLGHTLRVSEGRPFVQLKLAVDQAGNIAQGDGKPVWVSGNLARAQAHSLRAQTDAILVGRETVTSDDPSLTCRLPGMEDRSPIRVVMASDGALLLNASMLHDDGPRVWILASDQTLGRATENTAEAKTLIVKRTHEGRVEISDALKTLAENGITRLLVEGGPSIARSFADTGMLDEVVIMQGIATSTGAALLPFVNRGLDRITSSSTFQRIDVRKAGEDTITTYRARRWMIA